MSDLTVEMEKIQKDIEKASIAALQNNAESTKTGLLVDQGAKVINVAGNGPGKIQPPNN